MFPWGKVSWASGQISDRVNKLALTFNCRFSYRRSMMQISFVVLFSFIMNFHGLWVTLIYRIVARVKWGGNERARNRGINTQSLQFTTFLLISPQNNYPIILCVKDSESDFIASMQLNVFNGAFLLVPHGTTDILTQ